MQPEIGPVCLLHLEFMKWADDTCSPLFPKRLPIRSARIGQFLQEPVRHSESRLSGGTGLVEAGARRSDAKIDRLKTPADLSALGQAWPEVHRSWIDWARPLSGDDLQQPLTLRNMQGVEFTMPYWQLVMHLVNHGSYHRGQLATMLRQAGIKPPARI